MKTGVVLSTLLLLATATVPNAFAFSVTQSNFNEDGISVDIKQIKELTDNNLFADTSTPSQALAQTIATMVSKDPSGDNGNFTEVLNAKDVLQYFYPGASDKELEGAGITPVQAVEWLNSKGYTATIIDHALTTDEIKKHLDNSEPIVTVLENQNTASWLNKNYAGVLYAHDDVETGAEEGRLHASFIKTINYGEISINDGDESKAFQFANLANSPDPIQAESSFKWVSTITGIKRDPSWTNSQTIQGDKAKGVFEHKVTSDGTQSQVDFTDPEVMALLNKYPDDNKDHISKLAPVALINLYEDKDHQKTVKDLEDFLKIDNNTYVTSKNIMDWYAYLGFDFDVVNGRAPMELTKAINDSGRLYLTTFKPKDTTNPVKSTVALGTGYLKNTFNGYRPYWSTVRMSEQVIPFYDVPLTNEGLAQQQQLAQTFKYTVVKRTVNDPFSKTDYEEDKTIYNIRLKGTPDESGITSKPDESVETPPEESHVAPPTNANYIQPEYFNIRETQGQEPWCSDYVNAGAINTIYKAPLDATETKGAITTAKKLMQLDRPGVPDEELVTLPGTTVAHALEVMQKNYNVTADFEMRTLSFAEVKKEIDAGGIIQMDGNNSESTDAPGTGDNLGHAVAIVGYVVPKEGNQVPYYIVWNPWWNGTFYLSSNAKTYNLSGTKYKWTRTWHNWRKTDGTRSIQKLDPSIGDQKVMSDSNPYVAKQIKNPSLNSGIVGQSHYDMFNFGGNNDSVEQSVAQYNPPESILDIFKTGNSYWYSIRKDNKMIQLGINIAATEEENRTNNGAGRFVQDFAKLSSLQLALGKSGGFSLPVSSMAVIIALASGGILTKPALKAIGTILAMFGLKADPATFASQVRDYSRTVDALNSDFYDACKKE